MRVIPVDTARINLIAAGHVAAKPMFEDGKRVEGRFATDDYGQTLWVVDVLVDVEGERAEVVGVTVPSAVQPVVKKWNPVVFKDLEMGVYVDRRTNQMRQTFRASGIQEG